MVARRARARLACGALCILAVSACIPAYEPDSVHFGSDGVVYVHDAARNLVLRFEPVSQSYRTSLRLQPGSLHVAYAPTEHVLYVAHSSGAITRVDLANGAAEEPFAQLPAPPDGLLMLGSRLLAGRTILAADGTLLADDFWWIGPFASLVWSDAAARVYQASEEEVPSDLYWRAVDPATGVPGAWGESPYHGELPVRAPLSVSADGTELLTAAGLLYDAATLEILDALPVEPADALWLADGLVTLTETPDGATRLDHWNADRSHFNRQLYPGRPLRILNNGSRLLVVTQPGPRPAFHLYVPSDDPDGDGVANADDAFPLDPAASADGDLDGAPDAWNPGVDPEASGTELELDAYPSDSACWLAEHGQDGVCDVAGAIPDFDPDAVVVGSDGIAYLLASEQRRIHRWSLAEQRYLNPIVTDGRPSLLAYSQLLHRLYLAYPDRSLTMIELAATLDERPFATTFQAASGLAVADPHVVVSEPSGAASHHSFAPDGTRVTWMQFRHTSFHWAWSALHGRLYHFRDQRIPNDLQWEPVDPATGAIGALQDSPHHGEFAIAGPIRLSPDESRVLLGSGNLYDASTLDVVASLPIDPIDASWPAADALLTIRAGAGGDTTVERWSEGLRWLDTAVVPGAPRRILALDGGVAVMTLDAGRPRFTAYEASEDADGDGVPNDEDAFPLDVAASADGDGDGHPDAWNPGMGPGDSTSGLALDAFPLDSACWLETQGSGGACDVAAALPAYVPDRIEVGQDDVVYLLSRSQGRIFRWSAASADHENPIVIGPDARDMAYSAEMDRLYVGYQDGRITWIDPAAPFHEHHFATLHGGVRSLTAFGPFLFGPDDSVWSYVHDPDGARVQRTNLTWRRDQSEWSAANARLYLSCDGTGCSPDDVGWIAADPVTGSVQWGGDSPYHFGIDVKNPIRVEANGDRLLDGTGQVWDARSLQILGSLPWPITDAIWDASHLLVLRADANETSRVEQRDPLSLTDWGSIAFAGTPLRLLPRSDGFIVVTQAGAQPGFFLYTPPVDVDGDGHANPADAFPLDPAACCDADGDGAPDAWNPGYGSDDSTQGLTLDAFPLDFACQLPEHGVSGTCDFARIVPPGAAEPVCAADDVAGVAPAGSLLVSAATDLIPLCDGWVAYGDRKKGQLVVQDVFSGRVGLAAPLRGTPVDLELDAARKRIHVAEQDARVVEEVDLVTGRTVSFQFPDPVRAVRRDLASKLVVSTTPWTSDESREHYLLDVDSRLLEGPIHASHFAMQWHPERREFLSAFRSGAVARQVVDFGSGYLFVESAAWGYRGEALALSPDLQHVAFATREANGNSIAHFASGNLVDRIGIWRGADFPWDVAFDLASERLAASSNGSLQIFGVASHELLDVLNVAPCVNGRLREVGFSRGGAMAFVKQECGAAADSAKIHWLRLD